MPQSGLIPLYEKMINRCIELGDQLMLRCDIAEHEQPAVFFTYAHNHLTMAKEVIDFYSHPFLTGAVKYNPIDDPISAQFEERLNAVQSTAFVGLISSLEYCLKEAIKITSLLGNFDGRIYLSGIMKRSQKAQWIDAAQLARWGAAIEIRNCMVHRNGIADKSEIYVFPNFTYEFIADHQIKTTHQKTALLNSWVLESSFQWLDSATQRGIYD